MKTEVPWRARNDFTRGLINFYHSLAALVHATIVYAKSLFLLDIVGPHSMLSCGQARDPQKVRDARLN
ncbi:MAG: hypothetical protein KGN77_01265 [Xanthomonadaceae bacterium]|nr:hypothetical protein [Xanthomonadaceae bacterium]MDE1964001.1 hypothetical protein [Xanthomonadaceae bacterium]